MELAYTPQENAFREEVRGFIRANLPADIQDKVLNGKHMGREDFLRWHRALHKKGWVAPNWPVENGGTGWTPVQRHIFEDEAAEAGAPPVIPFGVTMCGPVVIRFGSDWQKQYFLPRILSAEHVWCQGFSEPGSGSDLASLRTKAVREGDDYIVNGQKIWTTSAHFADWIFNLVRTDPNAKKPQEGISFLLIDMKTPGITVRPIVTMDGGREVNEVFFDNVRVPAKNLVGEENKGWTYAKFLLGNERTGIARVGASKRELKRLKEIATQEQDGGRPLVASPRFRDKIAVARGRADGAGDHQSAHDRIDARRQGAGRRELVPQDQGLGDPATSDRARHGSRRPLRHAVPARSARGRLERGADRPRLRRAAGAALFQLPQDLDLWRLERDSKECHRQDVAGIVRGTLHGRGASFDKLKMRCDRAPQNRYARLEIP